MKPIAPFLVPALPMDCDSFIKTCCDELLQVVKARPLAITIIGWLFIVLGIVTLADALLPWLNDLSIGTAPALSSHEQTDLFLVVVARLAGLIGGIFILYGFNWSRWLLTAWMGFHIIISLQAHWGPR